MATKENSIISNLHTTLGAVSGVKKVYGVEHPYHAPQQSKATERPYINVGQISTTVAEEANAKTIKRMETPVEVIQDYDPANPGGSVSAVHETLGLVEAAVMTDHTRGGYAISTAIDATSRPSAIESVADATRPGYLSAEIVVVVYFGHAVNNPSGN